MLNPDIKLIFRNDKTEEVFLKNTFTNVLSSMSEGEFEILENYANTQNIEKTIDNFREKYDIDKDFMLSLIQKAEEIDILLTEDYQNKKRIKKSKEKYSPITIYLIGFLNKISQYLHLRTTFIFRGNIRFFKIFTIDLHNTTLEKFSVSKIGQKLLISLFWFTLFTVIIALFFSSFEKLTLDYIYDLSPPKSLFSFILILFGLILSTFFHEFGHYLLYRKHGGQTSEMGLALVLGFLPFIYVSTNSLYLWDNKRTRMLVTAAGILVDLVLTLAVLLLYLNLPSFIALFFLYFLLIRIAFNIMPFIPATDGYFLLTEIVSNPSLFSDAGLSFNKVFICLKKRQFNEISRKDLSYTLYLLMSYLFITAYYTSMSLIIIVPFLIRKF